MLLVNATPIGIEDRPLYCGQQIYNWKNLVYDLIYNPKETKLLKMAKEKPS